MAAGMMSRPREDPVGSVITVKLPRASVSATSPAMSGSTPGSLTSSMDLTTPSDSRNLPAGLQAVQAIGAIELLEHDDRPTFLVDLPDSTVAQGFDRFKTWACSLASPPCHEYGAITWTCTTLRRRFRFISGNVTPAPPRSVSPHPPLPDPPVGVADGSPPFEPTSPVEETADHPGYFGDAVPGPKGCAPSLGAIQTALEHGEHHGHPDEFTNQVLQFQPTKTVFDWTRVPLSDSLSEHIKFAKSVDWASTPLGPMSEWSYDLRATSNLIMGSPHPAAMYWGPDLICIYNAAYVELAGRKHPALMGQKYTDAWSEIWAEIEPIFKSAWECGQATMKHDNCLFIKRDGFLEETFSWAIVPLVGVEGGVVGLYNPAFENTVRRVNDRRMLTLREIGERTATATTVNGFWPQVQKGLEYNQLDVPFSLIYSVKEEAESDVSLQSGSVLHSCQVVLEGAPDVPDGHPAAPRFLDLRTSEDGFAPYMRQCMAASGEPLVLSETDDTLPKDLLEGVNWRGFGDPCTTMVVFSVVPTTKEAVTGFVVLGLNPRRPYDDNYKLLIHLLSRQLATSMASVVLFEEEIRRGQRAARLAALDRQELSMQLLLRTQEANESEFRFTRMAEFAPVGMFIADAQGHINYCNDMLWRISGHSRFDETEPAWMRSVRDEDRPSLEEAWQRLLNERVTISVEFRFKHSQQSGGNTIDTWVLMSAFPEKDGEGFLKSIFGCITDISSQKWAEKVQNERREEAVELKRQQENFIDITSHEMRNPLSAVLQCADQITNSITAFTAHENKGLVEKLLEACLDAANTIKFTQGRKRRRITVSLSTFKDIGEVASQGVVFFDKVDGTRNTMDIDNEREWGDGEKIKLHCSVEDTGPGLAEEELKVLFQRFQQATPRTHVQYDGSGLGLFISRILTEMQGGQIGVTSVRGSGSRFNFYMQSRKCVDPPAEFERIPPFRIGRKAQPTPRTAPLPTPTPRVPSTAATGPETRPPYEVLIVEDNVVNQKVLQRQLRNCGNNTFVANHGREALQTLQKSRFWTGQESEGVEISVILMDLEMPVMDGVTCARKIRQLEREGTLVKHIPIIAVTAYARPEQIENSKAAGIDDAISKPFRIPDLMSKIEELVGKYGYLSLSVGA